ncbi:hypothetical protein IQ07DRAFT_426215 [Pyrenochaeta sp. DS3sAY3a]|nr:hypothetical protein IQ07DRAFT_426215 [Pyrenochaeta sp. DS3sAY3a]
MGNGIFSDSLLGREGIPGARQSVIRCLHVWRSQLGYAVNDKDRSTLRQRMGKRRPYLAVPSPLSGLGTGGSGGLWAAHAVADGEPGELRVRSATKSTGTRLAVLCDRSLGCASGGLRGRLYWDAGRAAAGSQPVAAASAGQRPTKATRVMRDKHGCLANSSARRRRRQRHDWTSHAP